jgi:uncharacterized membrane protein YagU involved in acid resistance
MKLLTRLLGGYGLSQVTLAILAGGLLAGTLDVFVACAINRLPPTTILAAIASGLLGKAAFAGGAGVLILGFVLQEAMSLVIAKIYVLAAIQLPLLLRRPGAMGALYGVGVFAVMNFIVVPLSRAPAPHHPPSPRAIALNLAAMILFGLIVAHGPRLAGMRPRA